MTLLLDLRATPLRYHKLSPTLLGCLIPVGNGYLVVVQNRVCGLDLFRRKNQYANTDWKRMDSPWWL